MHYKRYEAPSLKEALTQVREELGPHALILSSRTLKRASSRTADSYWVEVTAAVEGEGAAAPNGLPRRAGEMMKTPPAEPELAASPQTPVVGDLPDSATSRRLWDIGVFGSNLLPVLSQLGFDSVLLDLYKKLEAQNVDSRIALSILEKVRTSLGRDEQENRSRAVLIALRDLLKRHIRVAVPQPGGGEGPCVMSMVGPTGVGKTTTVAKLAARYALEQGRKVALATLDTYRIAAVEQLKIYANVMGLPLRIIHTADDIRTTLKEFRDADVILMDTAGRSPNNDRHLRDLGDVLAGYPRSLNYLLVSAGVQEADMVRTVEKFSVIPLAGLVFTKLDECTRFGGMFNLAYRSRLPLAYFTTGQKVPDDLEEADVDTVLKRLFTSC